MTRLCPIYLLSLQRISGGDANVSSDIFKYTRNMIDSKALKEYVESRLERTDCFLVEVSVTPDNRITVEIDSAGSVDIDFCVELSRAIEARFDRDVEDYELEVGSAGLTSPLRIPAQYIKHIGHDVEVLTADGRKLKGVLISADDNGFTLGVDEKVKKEGQKRPSIERRNHTFGYNEVKNTKYLLEF